jgi:hypothetical protein
MPAAGNRALDAHEHGKLKGREEDPTADQGRPPVPAWVQRAIVLLLLGAAALYVSFWLVGLILQSFTSRSRRVRIRPMISARTP